MSDSNDQNNNKPSPEKAIEITASICRAISDLAKWAGLTLIAYFIYLGIDSLAGKLTSANISIDVLGKAFVVKTPPLIFGFLGLLYGYNQKRLRKKTTERLQGRIKKLETMLDCNRSSSKLTKRGETNPEDT